MSKNFYPINLDIEGKSCLVVGGGAVACRKARALLACKACVTVISPVAGPGIERLAHAHRISLVREHFQCQHMKGHGIVFAATDDARTNALVAAHARRSRALVNVVDVPELCDFIVPSIIRRGPVTVAVSTAGKSPMYARELRLKCEKCLTPAQGEFVALLGRIRARVISTTKTVNERKAIYRMIMDSSIPALLEQGQHRQAKALITEIVKGQGRVLKHLAPGRKSIHA